MQEKLCWWAPGKDPHIAFKSSLRFHLFQEPVSDFTQLEAATPSESTIAQKLCISLSILSPFSCRPMGGSWGRGDGKPQGVGGGQMWGSS